MSFKKIYALLIIQKEYLIVKIFSALTEKVKEPLERIMHLGLASQKKKQRRIILFAKTPSNQKNLSTKREKIKVKCNYFNNLIILG